MAGVDIRTVQELYGAQNYRHDGAVFASRPKAHSRGSREARCQTGEPTDTTADTGNSREKNGEVVVLQQTA